MKTTHDFLPLQVPSSPSPERRAEKKRSGIYKEGYNFTFSFIYIYIYIKEKNLLLLGKQSCISPRHHGNENTKRSKRKKRETDKHKLQRLFS
jgi:hypothetical protein